MKAYGIIQWTLVLCLALATPSRVMADPVLADESSPEIEEAVNRIEPIAVRYAAPSDGAEARAYAEKLIAQVREAVGRRGLPLHRVRVHLHYFGTQVPGWAAVLSTELTRAGISVGENDSGRIDRWDAPWQEVWPPKRARIAHEQQVSELLAEFREGAREHPELARYATAPLAAGILGTIQRALSVSMPKGLMAIVTPYLNSSTGVTRPSYLQSNAVKQAFWFMTLTGVAAAIQVMNNYAGDPNVNLIASIAVAASWRFLFTYFKDAGNIRHQMMKYYRHATGRVESSFWWSFASQLFDSLLSSVTFQAVLMRGIGNVSNETLVDTLLTSVAGSFAKIPIVQFMGKRTEELKRDTSRVADTVAMALSRYRDAVERGDIGASADIERWLREAMTLLSKACHQEALERIERVTERLTGVAHRGPASLVDALEEAGTMLQGCIRVANRLWWTNAGIDFAFDILKYGALLGVASVSHTYWGLALVGVGFLQMKHLLARTFFTGVRDVLDMTRVGSLDATTPEGAQRLCNAIENRKALGKSMQRAFSFVTRWTGLARLVGPERTARWGQWLFRNPRSDAARDAIARSLESFRAQGEQPPVALLDMARGLAIPVESEADGPHVAADQRYALVRDMESHGTLQVWLELIGERQCPGMLGAIGTRRTGT